MFAKRKKSWWKFSLVRLHIFLSPFNPIPSTSANVKVTVCDCLRSHFQQFSILSRHTSSNIAFRKRVERIQLRSDFHVELSSAEIKIIYNRCDPLKPVLNAIFRLIFFSLDRRSSSFNFVVYIVRIFVKFALSCHLRVCEIINKSTNCILMAFNAVLITGESVITKKWKSSVKLGWKSDKISWKYFHSHAKWKWKIV